MVKLVREVWTASLNDSSEVAQFGWWWFTGTGALSDLGAGVAACNNALWASWRTKFPTHTAITSIQLDEYDNASPVRKVRQYDLGRPTNPGGSENENALPPQLAAVVSFGDGSSSATARGRFYLPAPAPSKLTVAGRLALATRETFAGAFADYVEAVGAIATNWDMGVWSRRAEAFTVATVCSVGDVVDTQRRRRDALAEARTTAIIGA